MTTTDTPRTDAEPSNQPMLSAQSNPVELYHKLIAVTVDYGKALDACAEYREQLDESTADLMRTQIEMQLEIDKAEAEVERLRHINLAQATIIDGAKTEMEKLQAEVERLKEQYEAAAEWYLDNLIDSPRKVALDDIKAVRE